MSDVLVSIDKGEWYPVYSATAATPENPDPYGECVTVERSTYDRWVTVFAEFDEVQREIRNAVEPKP